MILATMISLLSALNTRPVTSTLAPVRWPTLAARLGRDRAGEAEFLLAQHLFQFGALDGDDLRLSREVGVEERGDLGAEVAHGFVLGLEVEDGDSEKVLVGGRRELSQPGASNSAASMIRIRVFIMLFGFMVVGSNQATETARDAAPAWKNESG